VLSAISLPIVVYLGVHRGLVGILGAAILVILIKPKWKHMTWTISFGPPLENSDA
jgi:hypothetical protein